MAPSSLLLAGIDGTRTGWLLALCKVDVGVDVTRATRTGSTSSITPADHPVSAAKPLLFHLPRLVDLLPLVAHLKLGRLEMLAIDMPMGLQARAERGGRRCDAAARQLLASARNQPGTPQKADGSRKRVAKRTSSQAKLVGPSSIFTPPSRPALQKLRQGGTHAEVSQANIDSGSLPEVPSKEELNARSDHASAPDESRPAKRPRSRPASTTSTGLGLSVQSYHIMPKISELDQLVVPSLEASSSGSALIHGSDGRETLDPTSVIEAHPECLFTMLLATSKASSRREAWSPLVSKKDSEGRRIRLQALANAEGLGIDLGQLVMEAGLAEPSHTSGEKALSHQAALRLLTASTTWRIVEAPTSVNKAEQGEGVAETVIGRTKIPADDVIDALACLCVALRRARGEARVLGAQPSPGSEGAVPKNGKGQDDPSIGVGAATLSQDAFEAPLDERGLPMIIWC